MATLTKMELAGKVMESGAGNIKEAMDMVEATLDLIKETLARGEDVLVSGFGKFHIREKKARKGRNPKTGEEIIVAPRRVVTFHASNEIRNRCKASVNPSAPEPPPAQ
jgi:integration host factor subunit alpha